MDRIRSTYSVDTLRGDEDDERHSRPTSSVMPGGRKRPGAGFKKRGRAWVRYGRRGSDTSWDASRSRSTGRGVYASQDTGRSNSEAPETTQRNPTRSYASKSGIQNGNSEVSRPKSDIRDTRQGSSTRNYASTSDIRDCNSEVSRPRSDIRDTRQGSSTRNYASESGTQVASQNVGRSRSEVRESRQGNSTERHTSLSVNQAATSDVLRSTSKVFYHHHGKSAKGYASRSRSEVRDTCQQNLTKGYGNLNVYQSKYCGNSSRGYVSQEERRSRSEVRDTCQGNWSNAYVSSSSSQATSQNRSRSLKVDDYRDGNLTRGYANQCEDQFHNGGDTSQENWTKGSVKQGAREDTKEGAREDTKRYTGDTPYGNWTKVNISEGVREDTRPYTNDDDNLYGNLNKSIAVSQDASQNASWFNAEKRDTLHGKSIHLANQDRSQSKIEGESHYPSLPKSSANNSVSQSKNKRESHKNLTRSYASEDESCFMKKLHNPPLKDPTTSNVNNLLCQGTKSQGGTKPQGTKPFKKMEGTHHGTSTKGCASQDESYIMNQNCSRSKNECSAHHRNSTKDCASQDESDPKNETVVPRRMLVKDFFNNYFNQDESQSTNEKDTHHGSSLEGDASPSLSPGTRQDVVRSKSEVDTCHGNSTEGDACPSLSQDARQDMIQSKNMGGTHFGSSTAGNASVFLSNNEGGNCCEVDAAQLVIRGDSLTESKGKCEEIQSTSPGDTCRGYSAKIDVRQEDTHSENDSKAQHRSSSDKQDLRNVTEGRKKKKKERLKVKFHWLRPSSIKEKAIPVSSLCMKRTSPRQVKENKHTQRENEKEKESKIEANKTEEKLTQKNRNEAEQLIKEIKEGKKHLMKEIDQKKIFNKCDEKEEHLVMDKNGSQEKENLLEKCDKEEEHLVKDKTSGQDIEKFLKNCDQRQEHLVKNKKREHEIKQVPMECNTQEEYLVKQKLNLEVKQMPMECGKDIKHLNKDKKRSQKIEQVRMECEKEKERQAKENEQGLEATKGNFSNRNRETRSTRKNERTETRKSSDIGRFVNRGNSDIGKFSHTEEDCNKDKRLIVSRSKEESVELEALQDKDKAGAEEISNSMIDETEHKLTHATYGKEMFDKGKGNKEEMDASRIDGGDDKLTSTRYEEDKLDKGRTSAEEISTSRIVDKDDIVTSTGYDKNKLHAENTTTINDKDDHLATRVFSKDEVNAEILSRIDNRMEMLANREIVEKGVKNMERISVTECIKETVTSKEYDKDSMDTKEMYESDDKTKKVASTRHDKDKVNNGETSMIDDGKEKLTSRECDDGNTETEELVKSISKNIRVSSSGCSKNETNGEKIMMDDEVNEELVKRLPLHDEKMMEIEQIEVKKGTEQIEVKKGTEQIEVKKGTEQIEVKKGTEQIEVKKGTEQIEVKKGTEQIEVKKGTEQIEVKEKMLHEDFGKIDDRGDIQRSRRQKRQECKDREVIFEESSEMLEEEHEKQDEVSKLESYVFIELQKVSRIIKLENKREISKLDGDTAFNKHQNENENINLENYCEICKLEDATGFSKVDSDSTNSVLLENVGKINKLEIDSILNHQNYSDLNKLEHEGENNKLETDSEMVKLENGNMIHNLKNNTDITELENDSAIGHLDSDSANSKVDNTMGDMEFGPTKGKKVESDKLENDKTGGKLENDVEEIFCTENRMNKGHSTNQNNERNMTLSEVNKKEINNLNNKKEPMFSETIEQSNEREPVYSETNTQNNEREPMLPETIKQSKERKLVLPETASQNNETEPTLPETNKTEPKLPESNKTQPTLPETNKTQPTLPETIERQPKLPETTERQPTLPETTERQPMLPETIKLSKERKLVLPETASQNNETEPKLPETNKRQPTLPETNKRQPTLPEGTETEPSLPETNKTQPTLPEIIERQPKLPETTERQPTLPETTETEPNLPGITKRQPTLPETTETQPKLPETNKPQPTLSETSNQNNKKGSTPSEAKVNDKKPSHAKAQTIDILKFDDKGDVSEYKQPEVYCEKASNFDTESIHVASSESGERSTTKGQICEQNESENEDANVLTSDTKNISIAVTQLKDKDNGMNFDTKNNGVPIGESEENISVAVGRLEENISVSVCQSEEKIARVSDSKEKVKDDEVDDAKLMKDKGRESRPMELSEGKDAERESFEIEQPTETKDDRICHKKENDSQSYKAEDVKKKCNRLNETKSHSYKVEDGKKTHNQPNETKGEGIKRSQTSEAHDDSIWEAKNKTNEAPKSKRTRYPRACDTQKTSKTHKKRGCVKDANKCTPKERDSEEGKAKSENDNFLKFQAKGRIDVCIDKSKDKNPTSNKIIDVCIDKSEDINPRANTTDKTETDCMSRDKNSSSKTEETKGDGNISPSDVRYVEARHGEMSSKHAAPVSISGDIIGTTDEPAREIDVMNFELEIGDAKVTSVKDIVTEIGAVDGGKIRNKGLGRGEKELLQVVSLSSIVSLPHTPVSLSSISSQLSTSPYLSPPLPPLTSSTLPLPPPITFSLSSLSPSPASSTPALSIPSPAPSLSPSLPPPPPPLSLSLPPSSPSSSLLPSPSSCLPSQPSPIPLGHFDFDPPKDLPPTSTSVAPQTSTHAASCSDIYSTQHLVSLLQTTGALDGTNILIRIPKDKLTAESVLAAVATQKNESTIISWIRNSCQYKALCGASKYSSQFSLYRHLHHYIVTISQKREEWVSFLRSFSYRQPKEKHLGIIFGRVALAHDLMKPPFGTLLHEFKNYYQNLETNLTGGQEYNSVNHPSFTSPRPKKRPNLQSSPHCSRLDHSSSSADTSTSDTSPVTRQALQKQRKRSLEGATEEGSTVKDNPKKRLDQKIVENKTAQECHKEPLENGSVTCKSLKEEFIPEVLVAKEIKPTSMDLRIKDIEMQLHLSKSLVKERETTIGELKQKLLKTQKLENKLNKTEGLENKVKQLNASLRNVQIERKEWGKKEKQLTIRVKELEKSIGLVKQLENQLAHVNKQLQQEKDTRKQQVGERDALITKLEEKVNRCQSQLIEKDHMINDLREQLNASQRTLTQWASHVQVSRQKSSSPGPSSRDRNSQQSKKPPHKSSWKANDTRPYLGRPQALPVPENRGTEFVSNSKSSLSAQKRKIGGKGDSQCHVVATCGPFGPKYQRTGDSRPSATSYQEDPNSEHFRNLVTSYGGYEGYGGDGQHVTNSEGLGHLGGYNMSVGHNASVNYDNSRGHYSFEGFGASEGCSTSGFYVNPRNFVNSGGYFTQNYEAGNSGGYGNSAHHGCLVDPRIWPGTHGLDKMPAVIPQPQVPTATKTNPISFKNHNVQFQNEKVITDQRSLPVDSQCSRIEAGEQCSPNFISRVTKDITVTCWKGEKTRQAERLSSPEKGTIFFVGQKQVQERSVQVSRYCDEPKKASTLHTKISLSEYQARLNQPRSQTRSQVEKKPVDGASLADVCVDLESCTTLEKKLCTPIDSILKTENKDICYEEHSSTTLIQMSGTEVGDSMETERWEEFHDDDTTDGSIDSKGNENCTQMSKEELKNIIASLLKSNIDMVQKVRNSDTALAILDNDRMRLYSLVDQSQEEFSKAEEAKWSYRISAREEEIADLHLELNTVEQKLIDVEMNTEVVNRENERMQSLMESMRNEAEHLKNSLKEAQEEIQKLEEESEFKAKMSAQEEEIKDLLTSLATEKQSCLEAEGTVQTLSNKLTSVETDLQAALGYNRQMQEDKALLYLETTDLQAKFNEQTKQMEVSKDLIKTLEKNLSAAGETSLLMEKSVQEKENALSAMECKANKLENLLTNKAKQIEAAEHLLEAEKAKNVEVESILQVEVKTKELTLEKLLEMENILGDKELCVSLLEKEVEKLKSEISLRTKQAESTDQLIERFREEMAEVKNNLEKLEKGHEEMNQEMNDTLTQKGEAMASLQIEVESLQTTLAKKTKEVEDNQAFITLLQIKSEEKSDQFRAEVEKLNAELNRKLQAEKEHLSSIREYEATVESLKEVLSTEGVRQKSFESKLKEEIEAKDHIILSLKKEQEHIENRRIATEEASTRKDQEILALERERDQILLALGAEQQEVIKVRTVLEKSAANSDKIQTLLKEKEELGKRTQMAEEMIGLAESLAREARQARENAEARERSSAAMWQGKLDAMKRNLEDTRKARLAQANEVARIQSERSLLREELKLRGLNPSAPLSLHTEIDWVRTLNSCLEEEKQRAIDAHRSFLQEHSKNKVLTRQLNDRKEASLERGEERRAASVERRSVSVDHFGVERRASSVDRIGVERRASTSVEHGVEKRKTSCGWVVEKKEAGVIYVDSNQGTKIRTESNVEQGVQTDLSLEEIRNQLQQTLATQEMLVIEQKVSHGLAQKLEEARGRNYVLAAGLKQEYQDTSDTLEHQVNVYSWVIQAYRNKRERLDQLLDMARDGNGDNGDGLDDSANG